MPDSPGVYWFLNAKNEVLYIGKAKSLKNRVTSYTQLKQLSSRISRLVLSASQVKFKVLESELEALLTEAELIRTYQPPFNILLKDDKSPIYILVTQETFPRVLQVRKKDIDTHHYKGTLLGPFSSGYKVREVLKIARTIFPWCSSPQTGNPCFYYHIDLCPGACINKVTSAEYQHSIDQLILFLRGKRKTVTTQLQQELKQVIAEQRFERAAEIRDSLEHITDITQRRTVLAPEMAIPALFKTEKDGLVYLRRLLHQYLFLPKQFPLDRLECYDVSNTSGTLASVAMVTALDGKMTPREYKLFNIRLLNTPNDFFMMQEALTRRQNHEEWGVPDLVVIDGGKGQLRSVLKIWQWPSPVISIAKDPDRLLIPRLDWPMLIKSPEARAEALKGLQYAIVKLESNHPTLQLIQRLRDEAHRFSKKQHTRRRTKEMFR